MAWTVCKNDNAFPVKFCLMEKTGPRIYGAFNLMGISTYRYSGWCGLLRNGDRWRIGEYHGTAPHTPIFEGTAWQVAEWIAVNANAGVSGPPDARVWVFPFDYKGDAP